MNEVTREPATRALLDDAWSALTGQPLDGGRVRFRGAEGDHLPSPLPVLPAMLAATAASTLAVAEVDAARRRAGAVPVQLYAAHVAAAAHSERYARPVGSEVPPGFAPLSRFWQTADGYVRTHANYAWHRQRALGALGCEDLAASAEDPEDSRAVRAVAEQLRALPSEQVEDLFADAGALAFAVRTAAQWHAHPQGRAVTALPVVTTLPGQRSGRALDQGRALSGVRVLDMTRVIAGPVATRTLAAWGADVLRVDSPHLPENEAQCVDTLVGKRSTLLDAAAPLDRARLADLLQQADVLIQGYRPGALARHGLGLDDLTVSHPHLTVVTLSAWGETGPWAHRRGFDSLVQAPTGIAAIEGAAQAAADRSHGDRPGALPAQALDHATGYLAAAAAALSLAGVTRGRPPVHARLSLAQTAAWLMGVRQPALATASSTRAGGGLTDPSPWSLEVPGPHGSVTVIAPPGTFEDGVRPTWRSTTAFGSDSPSFT